MIRNQAGGQSQDCSDTKQGSGLLWLTEEESHSSGGYFRLWPHAEVTVIGIYGAMKNGGVVLTDMQSTDILGGCGCRAVGVGPVPRGS